MQTTIRAALAIGIAAQLLGGVAAQAQDLSQMCKKVRAIEVGQWAEYQLNGSKEGESGRMRLAIVGKKEVAGSPAYWIEIQMSGEAGRMIMQVLAGGYPYDASQVHELVVKAGDQPAMKMPAQAMSMMRNRIAASPSLGTANKCDEARVVGWESIQVPAGEFRALHVKPVDTNADVWALAEIPFGLIESRGREGGAVLLAHGKDAKSSIHEAPVAIPGMGGF